jgi:predicted RNA methylase
MEKKMEIIRGKKNLTVDRKNLEQQLSSYQKVWLDLGTGDGSFVLKMARANPDTFFIGVDACRENLRRTSRCTPRNALFVIANVNAMPAELQGLAHRVTINFPWGSLLQGLLTADSGLMPGLHAVTQPGASVEVRLNSSALAEVNCTLAEGGDLVREVLQTAPFQVKKYHRLRKAELQGVPTDWAQRLAHGRDPHAIHLIAVR